MNTTDLKAKIEAAANMALADYASEFSTTVGTFVYAIRDIQNMNYDSPLPHIYCEELSSRKNLGTRTIEFPNVSLAFLDQDQEDSSAEQMEAIKARMEILTDLFLKIFIQEDEDMPEDVVFDMVPISKVNQGRFSGYGVTATLKATIGC